MRGALCRHRAATAQQGQNMKNPTHRSSPDTRLYAALAVALLVSGCAADFDESEDAESTAEAVDAFNGLPELRLAHSSKCAHVASTNSATPVTQHTCLGNAAQAWDPLVVH